MTLPSHTSIRKSHNFRINLRGTSGLITGAILQLEFARSTALEAYLQKMEVVKRDGSSLLTGVCGA